jgi:hypothetical protein
MRRSAITLTLFAIVASSCSLVRGDARVTNFGDEADAALPFAAAEEEPSGIAIGSAAVTDEGVARDAIDFIASDLLSGGDISGVELFGAGSVIATFVEPGCQFSGEQGALLAKTASAEESTTFVFIHSGATPGAVPAVRCRCLSVNAPHRRCGKNEQRPRRPRQWSTRSGALDRGGRIQLTWHVGMRAAQSQLTTTADQRFTQRRAPRDPCE